MKTKINFFLTTYDLCSERSIENVPKDFLDLFICYQVKKQKKKKIPLQLLKNTIKEWELPWNDYFYQENIFCEYSILPHLYKNKYLIDNVEYIGLFHGDVLFTKNSINNIDDIISKSCKDLLIVPENTFCKKGESLYLNETQIEILCKYMSEKMDTDIKTKNIYNYGWPSCALSITSKNKFLKFGKFLYENGEDIFNKLFDNSFGVNSNYHRICGIIERMWGFYLICTSNEVYLTKGIQHESYSYEQEHWKLKH